MGTHIASGLSFKTVENAAVDGQAQKISVQVRLPVGPFPKYNTLPDMDVNP